MKQRTPMRRTGFKHKTYPASTSREQETSAKAPLRVAVNASMTPFVASTCTPIEKDKPVRSEAYRRLVAAMPCVNCQREGRSQHAHENEGKGKALKLDDRRAMPLCADEPGFLGCHSRFDRYALFLDRAEHIRMGKQWSEETRALIEASGQWPAKLPRWTEK